MPIATTGPSFPQVGSQSPFETVSFSGPKEGEYVRLALTNSRGQEHTVKQTSAGNFCLTLHTPGIHPADNYIFETFKPVGNGAICVGLREGKGNELLALISSGSRIVIPPFVDEGFRD